MAVNWNDEELYDNSYQVYVNEIKQIPILTKEEEKKLFLDVARGDVIAKNRIIEGNLSFVVFLAKKYPRKRVSIMDLISEGNLGLQYAVNHFDISKGTCFLTYASYCVDKYILQYLFEKERLIKIPKHFLDEIISFRRVCNKLYLELGRNPSLEEIANFMNKSILRVRKYYLYNEDVGSIQSIIKVEKDASRNSGCELGILLSEYTNQPEEILLEKEFKRDLKFVLYNSNLTLKEIDVIEKRFGLDGHGSKTLIQIANDYGYTHEGIRQIEKRALEKLRKSQYIEYIKEDKTEKKLVKEC